MALSVAPDPDLLILDEPTLGQDWGHLMRLMDFLTTLNRQGVTILLITGLTLLNPLLLRTFIDVAIPEEDFRLLSLLALGMILIPLLNGVIGVFQRNLNLRDFPLS